jgi:hypothetical protein
MKQIALKSMSTDKLWMLRGKIAATLAAKIVAEKEVLEERLRLIKRVRVRRKPGPVAGSRQAG